MSTTAVVVVLCAAVVSLCLPILGCADDPFSLHGNPNNGEYALVSIDGAPLPTQEVVEGAMTLLDRTFTIREVYAIRISGGSYINVRWSGAGEFKRANNGIVTFVVGEGNGTRILRPTAPDEWAGEYHGVWYGILTRNVIQLWDGGVTIREYRRWGDDS